MQGVCKSITFDKTISLSCSIHPSTHEATSRVASAHAGIGIAMDTHERACGPPWVMIFIIDLDQYTQ